MLVVLASIAGCCGCSGDEAPGGGSSPRIEVSGAEASSSRAPTVQVVAEVDSYAQRVSLRVENRGTATTELSGRVELERREGDQWQAVDVRLHLRDGCNGDSIECLTLAPGAVFIPPPWLGMLGDAQCTCEQCSSAPAGSYRFVVRSCSGAHPVAGEPFEVR